MVYSIDRSKTMVLVLVLLFVVYSMRRIVLCLTLCHFVPVFFSLLSIAITSLGEEKASAFRTSVRFALVWFCLFSLPLGVWEGLRFVTVALPGLISYRLFLENSEVVHELAFATKRALHGLCWSICDPYNVWHLSGFSLILTALFCKEVCPNLYFKELTP